MRRTLEAEKRKRIPQIPSSTISERIEKGEISTKLSYQQYQKHIEGTLQYEQYCKSRLEKGLSPQSKLLISADEAQIIIEKYSGHGIIKVRKDGTPMDIEQITCDAIIGEYMQKGEWIKTTKAAIHYGKKGAHLVPIKGNHYD